MKQFFLTAALAAFALHASAQDTHVLQHIPPEEATATPNYWGQTLQGMPLWGHYLGHNALGDEEFGEKFDIAGTGEVVGIIAHIQGTAVSSGGDAIPASLRLYETASNGLPGAELAFKSMPMAEINTAGPTTVMFDAPVTVENNFFVTLDVGDYSHAPHNDTIVLMSGPDGSRPASDGVFGRNVIRWHGHGAPNWKDYLTQNFTDISTYFAIYPIMSGAATVSSESGLLAGGEPSFYPVPCPDVLNIRFDAVESREMTVRLFDLTGKMLESKVARTVAGENLLQLNMNEHPSGAYVIALESAEYRYARTVVKK